MENTKFDRYMESVNEQLTDNATEDYKSQYITYTYKQEQVNSNLAYFNKCMKIGLSPYKALLLFYDYLNGDYIE